MVEPGGKPGRGGGASGAEALVVHLGRVGLIAARRLIDAGKKDDARRKLDTLIGVHADTPIATEAEAMIEELDSDIDGLLDGF